TRLSDIERATSSRAFSSKWLRGCLGLRSMSSTAIFRTAFCSLTEASPAGPGMGMEAAERRGDAVGMSAPMPFPSACRILHLLAINPRFKSSRPSLLLVLRDDLLRELAIGQGSSRRGIVQQRRQSVARALAEPDIPRHHRLENLVGKM